LRYSEQIAGQLESRFGNMAIRAQQVIPVSQARTDISTILASFTSSTSSEPVFIGAHRKAEAVLVPVSLWEEILDVFEDIEIGKIVL
jgi:hypothetical protein